MSGDEGKILQAVIVGIITGLFSAGTIWGVMKTEIRWMRRDIDAIMAYLWPERRNMDRREQNS